MFVQGLMAGLSNAPVAKPEKAELSKPGASQSDSGMEEDATREISSLAQFAYSYQLRELEVNANQTSFSYYKEDMSMAMRATSSFNAKVKEEKISFDLDFSAEAVGLSAEDFEANGGEPIELKFSFDFSQTTLKRTSYSKLHKTIKPPDQILTDVAKAIGNVARQPGNKTVTYRLDAEAIQSLMGGDLELWSSLVLLMAAINLARKPGPSDNYTINISGKGKPYLEQHEEVSLESNKVTVDFSITIRPPAAAPQAAVSEAVEAAPVSE